MVEIPKDALPISLEEACSICSCGKSENLPYCDNTHKKLQMYVPIRSVKVYKDKENNFYAHCKNWPINYKNKE